MKKSLLFLSALPLLAACGASTPSQPSTSPGLTSLSGKVTDWNQGAATLDLVTVNNATGQSVVVGSGAVAADGTVSGSLPTASALAADLAPITQLNPPAGSGCTGGFTISDSTAHYSLLTEYRVKVDGAAVGHISPGLSGSQDSTGTVVSGELQELWYVDKPLTVSGMSTCPKSTLSFNAQLKQGWNVLLVKVNGPASGASGPISLELTNASSLAASWAFLPSSSMNAASAVQRLSKFVQ